MLFMKQLILSMSSPSPPSYTYCINFDISLRSTKNTSWRINRATRQHYWKGKRFPCLLIKCFDIKINQDVIRFNLPVEGSGHSRQRVPALACNLRIYRQLIILLFGTFYNGSRSPILLLAPRTAAIQPPLCLSRAPALAGTSSCPAACS